MHNQPNDLTQWIEAQRQTSGQLSRGDRPELHLHQHYYGPQQPPDQPREPRYSRAHAGEPIEIGPRLALLYVFVGALSLSVVLASLGAVLDSLNRPQVIYQQPQRGGW